MPLNAREFSDIDLNFTAHPVTKDIPKKKNIEAVKQSLKNIILTNHYERPFQPEIGAGIRALLFEPTSPFTASSLKTLIHESINNFEPRVNLISLLVDPDFNRNSYEITITFTVLNIPNPVTLQLFLERLR